VATPYTCESYMCPFISCEYSIQGIWAKKASFVFKFSVFPFNYYCMCKSEMPLNSFRILYAGYLGKKGELRVQSLIVGLRKNLRERVADIGGKVVGICVCVLYIRIYVYVCMFVRIHMYVYICIHVYFYS